MIFSFSGIVITHIGPLITTFICDYLLFIQYQDTLIPKNLSHQNFERAPRPNFCRLNFWHEYFPSDKFFVDLSFGMWSVTLKFIERWLFLHVQVKSYVKF